MTSMRIDSGGAAGAAPTDAATPERPVPMGTHEEVLQQVIASLDDQRGQARKVRNMSREIQRSQARQRIGDMRDAAHIRLAGACVSAAASAAGGVMGGYGYEAAGKATAATGKGVGDAFSAIAGMEDADAATHEMGAKVAGDAVADAGEAMQEASQRQERAMQKLDAILQAQVDSSRAVIRRG